MTHKGIDGQTYSIYKSITKEYLKGRKYIVGMTSTYPPKLILSFTDKLWNPRTREHVENKEEGLSKASKLLNSIKGVIMAAKPEQVCKYTSPEYKRYIKKLASRYYRRVAKRLLDEAPKKKVYSGYSD